MLFAAAAEAALMAKSKRKRVPKTVLKLPDLEQSKSAVAVEGKVCHCANCAEGCATFADLLSRVPKPITMAMSFG